MVALTGLSSDAAAAAFCQTSAREKKKRKRQPEGGEEGGCSPTRTEKRNDSLVSGWEHGRVHHVGADGTNKKNLSGMDKKRQKKKKRKRRTK